MNSKQKEFLVAESKSGQQSWELWSLIAVAWKYKLLLLVFVGAGLAGGYYYLQQTKPTYLASARLLVERQGAQLEKRAQLRHEPAFVQTQAEILRSRVIVERALESFTPASLEESLAKSNVNSDPVQLAVEALAVTPVEGTDVLQIAFKSSDSQDATKMLETVLESYSQFISESEKDTQLQSLEFLTKQEQQIRSELDQKKKEYRQLREKSALLGIGEESGRVQVEYLTNLGRTVADTKSKRAKLESLTAAWTKTDVMIAASLPNDPTEHKAFKVVADPNNFSKKIDAFSIPVTDSTNHGSDLKRIEQQLHAAQELEQKLTEQYGEKHPELKAARLSVESMEKHHEQALNSVRKSFQAELDAIKSQELELEKLYQSEMQRAKQLDVDRIEEQQFVDSIERIQIVHDSLLAEMKTRQMASASAEQGQGLVVMKVIAAPQSTGNPIWPIPKVIYALCVFVSLTLGGVLALGLDQISHRKKLATTPALNSKSGSLNGNLASSPQGEHANVSSP